jgi:hypothetical protein
MKDAVDGVEEEEGEESLEVGERYSATRANTMKKAVLSPMAAACAWEGRWR